MAGLGAGAIIGSFITAIMAANAHAEWNGPDKSYEAYRLANTATVMSIVGVAAGGALLAGGLATMMLGSEE
jgi:hypothetical protein